MQPPIVTPDWLNNNMTDPNLIILDASLPNNKTGIDTQLKDLQIKGASYFDIQNDFSLKNIELVSMLVTPVVFQEKARALGININSNIIVYDDIGNYSSPRARWMFNAMGFYNVSVLDGGLPGWISKNYATEPKVKKESTYKGNIKVEFCPEQVKSMEEIKKIIKSEDAIIIDARSSGRFNGTSPEPRPNLRSGHIPTSINLPFASVLDKGRFKSKEELITIFNSLKLNKKDLVFTCGSGITACIILLAAEIAGYQNLSVFDGSWVEWVIKN